VPEQLESIWESITVELRREAPDFKFHIWLGPLRPAAIRGRTLFVKAPEHIRAWVSERYLPLLRDAASHTLGERTAVVVVGEDWEEEPTERPIGPGLGGGLNPKYTFEQFVIGAGNRFGHAAALAVAELPAQAYNPLFIHGRPGLGKTHLLHAIGNYVGRYGSGLRVRYATVEDFTREFLEALRTKRTSDFKDGFRRADVLLIDDVQFLERKVATREEFFHTFNALVYSGRQLVLTSDRPPGELPELEERLAERFRSGLVVALEPPGVDVRRAILAKRARLDGVALPPAVLDEIALTVDSSVRALEAALIQVVAYASMHHVEPDAELARKLLHRLGRVAGQPKPLAAAIVDATAREFHVGRDELEARNRRPEVARARQVAMYLLRDLTDHSLPEIGRELGGRNHATVLHALRRVDESLRHDPGLRETVDNLRDQLGAAR
jgi:chromosomal replication initiator protein